MSDGGKENGRDSQQQKTRNPCSGEDFVRSIAKIAVAQICENEGFQSFQQSALEAFADVAVRYVLEIGKTANLYANLAGRSECNVLDVIRGLENLGSIQGFCGASDVNRSLSSSGILREIRQYISLVEEIPFAYELPKFPVSRERKPSDSFLGAKQVPPGDHIPPWLPVFPRSESNSNVPTSIGGEIVGDVVRRDGENKLLERGESSLMGMQHRLAANNGSESIFGRGDSFKARRNTDINPFLVPPLMYGEKEVSSILPPRFHGGPCLGNHVIPMEEFTLGIVASENKVSEAEEVNRSVELDGRPVVRFKLCSSRKLLRARKKAIAWDSGDEELAGCNGTRDDEKDERKRRAEKILKESMENPSDPAQL